MAKLPGVFHNAGILSALGASVFGLLLVDAPSANADPVTESWTVTCRLLAENFNGDPAYEEQILTGSINGIMQRYGLEEMDASAVQWRQITQYCPGYQQEVLRAENWVLQQRQKAGGQY